MKRPLGGLAAGVEDTTAGAAVEFGVGVGVVVGVREGLGAEVGGGVELTDDEPRDQVGSGAAAAVTGGASAAAKDDLPEGVGVAVVEAEAMGPAVVEALRVGATQAAVVTRTPEAVEDAYAGSRESWNQRLRQRRWRRKQLEDGVRPSPRIFHGLMEAYARAGEWKRALECLDDMARGAKGELDGQEGEGEGGGRGLGGVGVRAGVAPDSTSVGWAIQVRFWSAQWGDKGSLSRL